MGHYREQGDGLGGLWHRMQECMCRMVQETLKSFGILHFFSLFILPTILPIFSVFRMLEVKSEVTGQGFHTGTLCFYATLLNATCSRALRFHTDPASRDSAVSTTHCCRSRLPAPAQTATNLGAFSPRRRFLYTPGRLVKQP